ncbi:MAG TPA: TetR family transcriptional regulator [Kribbella sp.]|nr:TetR family transcriptional regulator [Kribbella sp.]
MNKRRGRPSGPGSDARARILREARRRFLEHGYRGTTLRAVAAGADVDVALISYYFGSKQALFGAAMAIPIGPSQVLDAVLRGDPEGLSERLLAAVIRTWEDPEYGPPLRALVSTAMQDETVLRVFRDYVEREVISRLAAHLRGPRATERATTAVTVVVGMIFSRYVLELAPSTTMSVKDTSRTMSPCLRVALVSTRRGPVARRDG